MALNFKTFVGEKSRIISLNIFQIKQIRKYLTQNPCKQLMQSLVISHLKQCVIQCTKLFNKASAYPLKSCCKICIEMETYKQLNGSSKTHTLVTSLFSNQVQNFLYCFKMPQ
jgi:hypothetical protein